MFCKKCGKELEDGAVFCQFCGQKQTENVEENVQKKEEQISNKKLILAGTVMAAAILAVIAVFKLFTRDKGNAVADNTVVEETTEIENIAKEIQEEKSEKEAIDTVDSEDGQAAVEETETAEAGVAEEMKVSHIAIGENEYWFDEDGDLIRIKEGELTTDIQYLIDSAGNKVKGNTAEKFIDMASVSIIWNNEEIVPCCSTKGHMIESITWNGYGGTTQRVFTYDRGNITEGHMTYQGDNGERKVDVSFQYDDNNQIIISGHEVSSFEDEKDDYRYEITCAFSGDRVIKCTRDSDSLMSIQYNVEREYDNSGNLVREKFSYTPGGNHTNETIYQYDGNGNLVNCNKMYQYEYEGVEKANDVDQTVYSFDENGNVVKRRGKHIELKRVSKVMIMII